MLSNLILSNSPNISFLNLYFVACNCRCPLWFACIQFSLFTYDCDCRLWANGIFIPECKSNQRSPVVSRNNQNSYQRCVQISTWWWYMNRDTRITSLPPLSLSISLAHTNMMNSQLILKRSSIKMYQCETPVRLR